MSTPPIVPAPQNGRLRKYAVIAGLTVAGVVGVVNLPSTQHSTAPLPVNCALPAGSSGGDIANAYAAAGSGLCINTADYVVGVETSGVPSTLATIPKANVVQLAAGVYNLNAQLSLPCGSQTVALVGPQVPFRSAPTASLNWVGGGNTNVVQINSCGSQERWFQHLEVNGNRPSPGGGGGFRIAPGASNWHIVDDYIHGFQGDPNNSSNPDNGEGSVYYAGCALNSPGCNYQTSTNTETTWNQIGNPASLDCSNLMNQNFYGGHNYDGTGGTCGSYGVHSGIKDATFAFNNITNLEQALKGYDAGTNGRCFQSGVSGCVLYFIYYTNWRVANNHLTNIHRNAMETQARAQGFPGYVTQYNDVYDLWNQNYTGMGLSLPSCCGNGPNNTTVLDNVILANPNASTNPGNFIPEALEWWSDSSADHNLIQGNWGLHSNGTAAAIQWGANSNRTWTANYNVIQIANNPCCGAAPISQEEPWNKIGPQQIGNVLAVTSNFTPLTSAAPTISPSPSLLKDWTMVTISDAGFTGNTPGPRGNTSFYYTTDGSTPTTNSPACYQSCSILIAPGSTVKALGMWGSLNQPRSYPAGFGFVPSPVQTWAYTGTPGPPPVVTPPVVPVIPPVTPPAIATLTGAWLAAVNNANTATVGGTIQFSAIGSYSDGSKAALSNAAILWTTSDKSVMTIDSNGLATAVGPGTANAQAQYGNGRLSSPWTVTVTDNASKTFPVSAQLKPGTYTVTVSATGVVTVSAQ